MKIECDKCGAKYSIADEKVRGKTFKIRCKKCSNVIIVRDKGEAEAESDAGGDDEDAAAGWHLAVDGETVGPLSEQEVRDRFARGEIDRDTSVWQEGFDDWLLLGDVGAFSDLTAAAAAAAPAESPLGDLGGDDDDPFKGTGIGESDDYGGEAAAGAAASASAASSFGDSDFGAAASSSSGHDAGSDPASPRVNQLSGARNENSVLFSLDSLSSVAMGGGGGGSSQPSVTANASTPLGGGLGLGGGDLGGGGGGGGAASSAPSQSGNSEGSGLIDIRAMGAMLGAQGAAADPGTDFDNDPAMGAPLPSFGGFTGLAEAKMEIGPSAEEQQERLVAEAAAAAAAAAASQPKGSNVPLYIIILLLAVGLGGIAYYVLNMETPEGKETIVYKPGESKTIIEYRDRPGAENEAAGDDSADDETDGEELVDDSAGGTTKRKRSGKKKKSTKTGEPSDPLGSGDKPADTKAADDKKSSQTKKSQSVECLLDPNAPGCKAAGGSTKKKPKDKPPAGNLPASLGMADIKSGFASAKSAASSKCKGKAKPGDKVKVKVSIAGSTGKVTKATPQAPFAGTAVGTCVANELKKASFKKFQKTSMGAITSVKF